MNTVYILTGLTWGADEDGMGLRANFQTFRSI